MRAKKEFIAELDKALRRIRAGALAGFNARNKDTNSTPATLLLCSITGGVEARVAVNFEKSAEPEAHCAYCAARPITQIQPMVSFDGGRPDYALRVCAEHKENITEAKLSAKFVAIPYSDHLGAEQAS